MPDQDWKRGICASCGLLAKFIESADKDSIIDTAEVSTSYRTAPDRVPHCMDYQADLPTELKAILTAQPDTDGAEAVAVVIKKPDRNCPEWMPYRVGETAQQHLARRDAVHIEDLRQETTEALKTVASEHAKTAQIQVAILERIEKSDVAAGKQEGRFNRWFVYLAVFGIILATGQLFFPNGLPWIGDSLSPSSQPIIVMVTPSESPTPTVAPTSTVSPVASPSMTLSTEPTS